MLLHFRLDHYEHRLQSRKYIWKYRPQIARFCSSLDVLTMITNVGYAHLRFISWWLHQMGLFSALPTLCEGNPPVTGGFPSQRPVTRSFDVFFDLHLNKRLSKQSRRRWFETPSHTLWRHCNVHWVLACPNMKNNVEWRHFNPCRTEFILGDIEIYSQFLSFVAIGIVEVLSHWMLKSLYSEKPIPQLLMTCRHRDPSHQQPSVDIVSAREGLNTLCCRYNAVNFLEHFHNSHPISRPLCNFEPLHCCMKYPGGCYIGPRYNGTWLYTLSSRL